MSAHTPGPWIAREYVGGVAPNTHRGCEITCSQNTQIVCEIPDYCFYGEEVENNQANARLIAAAPDLLAALIEARDLIEMLAFVDREPAEGSVGHRIRAAIAKATQP